MQKDISYLPLLFHSIQKKISESHETIMASSNLTRRHIPFIMVIKKYDNGITQQELSEYMHMDKAHTSRTLKDLEEKGYVEKVGNNTYKNKYLLSQQGEDIFKTIKDANQQILNRVLGILTEEELQTFEKIIRKLIQEL